MKVRALCNVKYDAEWHKPGEVFEILDDDFAAMKGAAEEVGAEQPVLAETKPEVEKDAGPKAKTVRRSRK